MSCFIVGSPLGEESTLGMEIKTFISNGENYIGFKMLGTLSVYASMAGEAIPSLFTYGKKPFYL